MTRRTRMYVVMYVAMILWNTDNPDHVKGNEMFAC